MAADRPKSFVFNLEWFEVLKEYPSEVRLEVYEAAMEYAASGTLPELKPIAKMAFSFIKKEMDYNRERYDAVVAKRAEAGKASQRKQTRAKQANAPFVEQAPANATDNVNDNDYYVVGLMTREAFLSDFFKAENSARIEAFCMTAHIDPATMKRLAEEVLNEWQLTEEKSHQDLNDAKRHLLNQIRIKLAAERRVKEDEERKRAEHRPKTASRSPDKGPRSVNGRWDGFDTPPPTE